MNTSCSPGTEVIPLEPKDQWKPIDQIRSIVFFIARLPLDEEKLRHSLDNLIRNYLPILAARIAPIGKTGGLAYHIPAEIPHDRRLFEWSSRRVPTTLAASQLLPSRGGGGGEVDGITWGTSIPQLTEEWAPATWPKSRLDDGPDAPLLLVHVTHYTDTDVLGVNLPHAVVDQMGFASFIRAWLTLAAGGKPSEFLQLPPGTLDGPPDVPSKELRRKGTFRLKTRNDRIRILLGFAPELIREPDETRRLAVFPEALITKLRIRYQETINQKHGLKHAKLTNGDVLVAIYVSSASEEAQDGVAKRIPRGRHPALPGDKPYLHNAIVYSTARVPVCRTTPAHELARQNRVAVDEALKPESIDRSLAVTREMYRGGYGIHICEPGELSYSVTNWASAWHGIDFSGLSPATKRHLTDDDGSQQGSGGEESTAETEAAEPDAELATSAAAAAAAAAVPPLVLGHALMPSKPIVTRFNVQIMCKAEGGYWCDLTLSARNTPLVDKLLEGDPLLESL
ncbi:Acetyltransferase BOT5 [Colletotrichum spinosum]|uniref:Acetyltransferase BOT5 n=1 Tax=Colletotrichum spinosum TaxID=1347390 RepID=A0A4R8PV41_9PEZI|nr:Acetyltransferase BOT5 [Colletotrichum spinosum]